MLNIISYLGSSLLVWPHEVEPWFHSWRVETLDAKYNGSSLLTVSVGHMKWSHGFILGAEVE